MPIGQEKVSMPDGRAVEDQPRWRQDFPVDWPQDHYVSRRDFTRFMVLTSLAFAAGQFWILAVNFMRRRKGQAPWLQIATIDQLPVGGAKAFAYPAEHDSCVLVRTGENAFVAFSQKCTHLSCAVVPQPEKNCFRCPCHEGFFDLTTGEPIAGPPRRRVPRINLEVSGAAIYATSVEEQTI